MERLLGGVADEDGLELLSLSLGGCELGVKGFGDAVGRFFQAFGVPCDQAMPIEW